ncbi:IclR family transcriptional regulator domain-containing protein [Nocardia sp. bgisy118]|uniref:IclR family transcriptional regulator domain-containing protein n=1 Tax=Nocardia sp. bgisy118 TaxID=3413786 RepID=UPI003F4A5879
MQQACTRLVKPIGPRSPLHASSTGKSVLAHLPPNHIESYLEAGLSAVTTKTITDPEALRTDLQVIRERGYAITHQELTEGIVSVAACIQAGRSRPIAAISISAPAARMAPRMPCCIRTEVAAAAARVAAQLRK